MENIEPKFNPEDTEKIDERRGNWRPSREEEKIIKHISSKEDLENLTEELKEKMDLGLNKEEKDDIFRRIGEAEEYLARLGGVDDSFANLIQEAKAKFHETRLKKAKENLTKMTLSKFYDPRREKSRKRIH